MSKEYEIITENDFDLMVNRFKAYFAQAKHDGKKFQKLRIISKRWVKSKSSSQHRAYWSLVGELKAAFLEQGYHFNQEQLHELMKRASGFTEMQELPDGSTIMVTKSIADKSDDATSMALNNLIEFTLMFSAEKLGVNLDIKSKVY